MEILFKGICKDYYLQTRNQDILTPTTDTEFIPFRKAIQTTTRNVTPLIFKIGHTPRFSNKQLKAILNTDPFSGQFATDRFSLALEQFKTPPLLCKTRTTKIQDLLIRSKFKHDLPDTF
jgi:hypothetical protein